jgi:subtilisin family serine protease
MLKFLKFTVGSLLIILFFSGILFAGFPSDSIPTEAKVSYAPGLVMLNFKERIRPGVDIKADINGNLVTGISSLDRLNQRFKGEKLWSLFPEESLKKRIPGQLDLSGYYEIQFPENANLDELVNFYSQDPNVLSAEKVAICPIFATPNDSLLVRQWHIDYPSNDMDVDALEAWDINTGDSTLLVGIVDTGILYSHWDIGGASPYTNGNVWVNWAEYNGTPGVDDDGNGYIDDIRGWDWVTSVSSCWSGEDCTTPDNDPKDFAGHGTHLAGIVGAMTNNVSAIAGLAGGWYPNKKGVKLMPLRVGWLANDGLGYVRMDFCAQGINYATNKGAKVINCSWGVSNNSALHTAALNALNSGVMIVKSAGNYNSPPPPQPPTFLDTLTGADGNNVISVTAINSNGQVASWANYGDWVDLSAPGVHVYSTYSNHYSPGFTYMDGTSMAAPMVAGVIALIRSNDPTLPPYKVANLMYTTADNIDSLNPGKEGLIGRGKVNAWKALAKMPAAKFIAAPIFGEVPLTVQFTDSSTGNIYSRTWNFGDDSTSNLQNPSHTYQSPGVFSPRLTVVGYWGTNTKTNDSLIGIYSDTTFVGQGVGPAGQTNIAVPIIIRNDLPSTQFTIPLSYGNGTAKGRCDSVSFIGSRAAYFASKSATIDTNNQKIVINLSGGNPPLASGTGTIVTLYFTLDTAITVTDTIWIDSTTVGSDSLFTISTFGELLPHFTKGFVWVLPYQLGDVNRDEVIDIGDVVFEINYVFYDGPAPDPLNLGDVNKDGIIDIGDIVYLINYVFYGGPPPQ